MFSLSAVHETAGNDMHMGHETSEIKLATVIQQLALTNKAPAKNRLYLFTVHSHAALRATSKSCGHPNAPRVCASDMTPRAIYPMLRGKLRGVH